MSRTRLSQPDLLGIHGLQAEDLLLIFRTAAERSSGNREQWPKLGGVLANLILENSTRTRNSFHAAGVALGMNVINVSAGGSSISKGETLLDTVRVAESIGVDLIVLRHSMPGAAEYLSRHLSRPIVNAGDGRHEHPTQALLDCYTLWRHWNCSPDSSEPFVGKRVVILGDISHGRVALSNILALKLLGAEVVVCGPPTLLPRDLSSFNVDVQTDVSKALHQADAVNVLRMQLERQNGGFVPSLREYARLWGLNEQRELLLKNEAVILHPGPINRNVELSSSLADSERSLYFQQISNGVAIRAAVIELLINRNREGKD